MILIYMNMIKTERLMHSVLFILYKNIRLCGIV